MSCRCNGTLSNSGKPGCDPLPKKTDRLVVVQLVAGDGTRNKIDPTATFNAAFFSALLNHADGSKRWYPLPKLKNVDGEKGESIKEEFEDGSMAKVKDGTRNHTSLMVGLGPHYLGKIKEYACVDFGVYHIDFDGNLIGEIEEDGFIYPIPVEKAAWDPIFQYATDTTVGKIVLNYLYSQSALDENLEMITADEIDVNLTSESAFNGLFDVNVVISAITINGFTATLTTDFGTVNNRTPVEGRVLADFAVNEITPTPGAIAITSVTESAPGVYDFVFTVAQTSGDDLELSETTAFTGYEMPTTAFSIP